MSQVLTPPPAPKPDRSKEPRYVGNETIEVLYSDGDTWRAVVTRDPERRFRVRVERWETAHWDPDLVAFWSQTGGSTTITDTLENAHKLAAERLVEASGQGPRDDV